MAKVSLPLGTSREVSDRRGRPLHDLRISVTDRCNFRCVYCMPKEIFGRDYAFLETSEMLTFTEIERLVRASVNLGVRKVRLTGGEPLLRKGIEDLVARIAAVGHDAGVPLDIALTTNGSALKVKAAALKAAGLNRVTVSMDALDDAVFRDMNDVNFGVDRVLAGIAAAEDAGLGPVKINMVVQRSRNLDQIVPMAEYFKDRGHVLRFIEFMDVGETNGWDRTDVVPTREIVELLDARFGLMALEPESPDSTSTRWGYADGSNEIGFISSVTGAFCSTCSRARISTDGQLFTCLFATQGTDLRSLLRSGYTDEQLQEALAGIWGVRADAYSLHRGEDTDGRRTRGNKVEMSFIGG